ncbi:hypothetical protein GCM10023322_71390 [Rugosimonospora acidiphila]|uniref:HTH luxR-type domain-containing protein n=1 Tax=Rugosimonospora acidiphila TaxID=556531 RepID=A0ABP9SKV7_9ACTN
MPEAKNGTCTEDIGTRLAPAPATVRNYLSNAISKTGARNRIDAIRIARDAGWLSLAITYRFNPAMCPLTPHRYGPSVSDAGVEYQGLAGDAAGGAIPRYGFTMDPLRAGLMLRGRNWSLITICGTRGRRCGSISSARSRSETWMVLACGCPVGGHARCSPCCASTRGGWCRGTG